MEKFKWGPNFLHLNAEELNIYSKCANSKEVIKRQSEILEKMDAEALQQRNQPIDLPPEVFLSDEKEEEMSNEEAVENLICEAKGKYF